MHAFTTAIFLSNFWLGTVALGETLATQRARLLQSIKTTHSLSNNQLLTIKKIIDSSPVIGQGNPAISKHPISTEQCRTNLKKNNIELSNSDHQKICGGPYMAPLYNPKTEKPTDAKTCIDQFEFPNIPCDYPVVWVRTSEAAMICEAMDKRLCDAHEWEGGCQGELLAPDYNFELAQKKSPNAAIRAMRQQHNRKNSQAKRWSYGPSQKKGICAMNSSKDAGCNGGDWKKCGSNTYPSGSFPTCKSTLGVYDQNGNAAEHMNLPLTPEQMASHSSKQLGHTEMKGSWFIFDKYHAHQDWCRWRAPYWHGTKTLSPKSHHNYHLGFRCCKSLPAK
jgi:hypothetical protein